LTSLGYTRKEVVGRELGEFARASSPDPDEPWGQGPPQDRVSDQERQLLRKDGGVLQTLIRTVALCDADGQTRGERAMYIDISQRRKAEQEIYRLQAQLYQSQKVEAIGRLAGGVAHDFNNVLTAVLGYSTMLLEQIDEGKPMYADLKEIEAAERAASLTHKLMTFTHQQVLTLVTIDLNRVVREIGGMLQRLIGEDVIMTTQLAVKPCGIRADPTLLEQILVNLAVNARDAMPSGGSLARRDVDRHLCDGSRRGWRDGTTGAVRAALGQ
jgi:PAS domain S-box-containing protein